MAKFNPSKAVNVIEKNCENLYLKQKAGSGPKNPLKFKCTILIRVSDVKSSCIYKSCLSFHGN